MPKLVFDDSPLIRYGLFYLNQKYFALFLINKLKTSLFNNIENIT